MCIYKKRECSKQNDFEKSVEFFSSSKVDFTCVENEYIETDTYMSRFIQFIDAP